MILTDELLLSYQRCPRRTFLDICGDWTQIQTPSDFVLKLRRDSRIHQQTVASGQIHHQPNHSRRDWQSGVGGTLELMQMGVERIYQGVLTADGGEGVTLLSRPDLLVKQSGKSKFGDWIYVPTSIKLGKRSKPEYKVEAAFQAYVLANIQGVLPPTAWLVLRERRNYAVNLDQWLPQMQLVVQNCLEMLRSQAEPEVFISRQKCSLCQWYGHCYAIAKSQQHLSLLPGVTPSRYQYLQTIDINTVESLANIDPIQLEPALDTEVAQKLVWQAQVTHQNQAIAIPDDWGESAPLNKNALRIAALTKLKTQNSSHALCPMPYALCPIELYFDIEAEPEQNFNYLLGVLVVNHSDKTETFYPLLAERPTESTALIWQQFLDLVQAYPESPIFHFCDYEIQTVKQLAKQHKTPYYLVEKILSRFVDVYEQVTKTVVLPIESYSLKSIANWIGFEWRDSQANGSQSICWYDKWLKTSDRTFLEAIIRYNEDDCRATYQVKNWLVENLPELGIARKKPESLSIAISNY